MKLVEKFNMQIEIPLVKEYILTSKDTSCQKHQLCF